MRKWVCWIFLFLISFCLVGCSLGNREERSAIIRCIEAGMPAELQDSVVPPEVAEAALDENGNFALSSEQAEALKTDYAASLTPYYTGNIVMRLTSNHNNSMDVMASPGWQGDVTVRAGMTDPEVTNISLEENTATAWVSNIQWIISVEPGETPETFGKWVVTMIPDKCKVHYTLEKTEEGWKISGDDEFILLGAPENYDSYCGTYPTFAAALAGAKDVDPEALIYSSGKE